MSNIVFLEAGVQLTTQSPIGVRDCPFEHWRTGTSATPVAKKKPSDV